MSRFRSVSLNRNVATLALTTLTALTALTGCATTPPPAADTSDDTKPAATSTLTGTLRVAAAASLQPAFEQLTAEFSKQHPGVTFESLTFDGSSTLATQIIAGAPVDVFASADEKNMAKVADAKLLAEDPTAFATSSLQIAVAPGNPLGITSLADLAKPAAGGSLPTVVICAPEVPCGSASQQLLQRDGVALTPASEEQNVTAVLTKVSAGEADAGLIYRSDVLRANGKVEGIEIAGSIEAAGRYMVAPLAGSQAPEAAAAFAKYLRGDSATKLLDQLGFGPA